ncbi:MAG: cysteine synthase A [Bacillota bacterium]|nr:cysteine synthase A [Bacillota bacterium]HQD20223.1 cysteine synthase A [Bacillota bacterium]
MITALIGNTPLLKIEAGPEAAALYIKLESYNPGGSIKDRVAMAMLQDARDKGLIRAGTTIIEATSGNTGIGLAMAAAAMGIPLLLIMPDTMSEERRKLLRAYGAQLILTPGSLGMQGAIDLAKEMLTDEKYLHLDQFSNPANPRVHYSTTGPEIYRQLEGKIDAFVAGVGTGGTLTGAGGFLKSRIAKLKIYAVEPALSPVLSGGKAGPHPLQGIGAGFIPPVLNIELIDSIYTVQGEDAFRTAREMARRRGVLVGISSGAALWAALQVARELGPGKTVVTIAPDSGERYLSTPLYAEEED